jgi:hypothetical protein
MARLAKVAPRRDPCDPATPGREDSQLETTQTEREPPLWGCGHKSPSIPEERLTRQTRGNKTPSRWNSSQTSRRGPGVVAQWRSPSNGERLSAQAWTPRRSVEWCSQRHWALPTQGVENPPSATCWYRLYRQRRTRETWGKSSVQKCNTCQVSKRTTCQLVKFWQMWIKFINKNP